MTNPYLAAVFLLSTLSTPALWAQVETFDLPRLDDVRIDGDFNDWSGQGLGVEVLLQEEGSLKPASDHNVHFQAGWNQQGILLHLVVQDDNWVEFPEQRKYYSADVVEVFLARKRGDKDVCQWYITPGMTNDVPEPGVRFRELRRGPTKGMPAELQVARKRLAPNKYQMELCAPWSSIGETGTPGAKAAFQIWVNDKDAGSLRKRYMSIFYPAKGASYATNAMHNVVLRDSSVSTLRISARGEYDTGAFQPLINLWGTGARSGQPVTVKQGDMVIGTSEFGVATSNRSTAQVRLPRAPSGKPYRNLDVYVQGQQVNSVSLPYSDVLGKLKEIYEQREMYREMFNLDQPWLEIEDAPLLARHRGLAAAGLNLLDQDPPPSNVEAMEVLAAMIAMLKALENGEDYFGQQRNSLWGYYFCGADGTGQRFSMTIPKGFSAQRSYPLYVNLHGNGGRPLPSKAESRQSEYFQIRPWGRGDISYFGLGETDVLLAIRHMRRWYPIDPNRIYLGGHSMGGNATWDLASKHTNLFAALAPKAGRSSDDYYENFRHLPALIQHGAKDSSQPVDFGRYTASRLRQLGFPVVYKEFPNDGHGIRNPFPVEAWLLPRHRPSSPKIITYTCDTVRNGQAYWTTIRRFLDPHRTATIDARVVKGKGRQIVSLKLTNVQVIELDLNAAPVDKTRTLVIDFGDHGLRLMAPLPLSAILARGHESWRRVDAWQEPTKHRSYLPGACGNLYMGEPLLIVFPTDGDEVNRKRMALAAQSLLRFGGFGGDMITGSVPMKADQDVTPSDIQHRNLILFGGPAHNLVTRRLAERLPVQVNAAHQFELPGHSPVDVQGASLLLTMFNPLAPKRLVHVIWRNEFPELAPAQLARFARRLLPGSSGRYPHNIPDLQISSPSLEAPIRRQFNDDWKLKPRTDVDRQPLPRIRQEGVALAKLRLIHTKANADFAISPSMSWQATGDGPSLEQFRYRNYRINTFKANLTGDNLRTLFTATKGVKLASYPALKLEDLEPQSKYSIAAPEAILWTTPDIKNRWTDVEAGPDILKHELIREIYGVDE